jgi:hypothetical protein
MVLWEPLLPCVHNVPGFSPDLEIICTKTCYGILQAFQAIARVGLQNDITITYFQILSSVLPAVFLNEMYWTGVVCLRKWFKILKTCGLCS